MKFLSLIAALLLEQVRPLRDANPLYAAFERYAAWLEHQLNAGQYYHGMLAWCLAVVPAVIVTVLVQHLLDAVSPILAWAWNIAILYLTMGFRQFSHYFREIARALREGDIAAARERLARWRGKSAAELTPAEIARVSIELALAGSHRHVFGPIAWFLLLGPAGALAYRLSAILADAWRPEMEEMSEKMSEKTSGEPSEQANENLSGETGRAGTDEFGLPAQRFFFAYDWLPARLTAASFAVVGNFEDAIYCWRTQAPSWRGDAPSILLASGGGAMGVRLGDALHGDGGGVEVRPELGLGDEADVDYMQSAIGLIWRALVLWIFLVFVVTVAHSLG